MFTKLTPNLMVTDVNRTVEYYYEILGFDFIIGVLAGSQEIITKYDTEKSLAFALVQQNGVQFMFQSQQSFINDPPLVGYEATRARASCGARVSQVKQLYQIG